MTLPVVYTVGPAEVRLAVESIRARVKDLAEPRLYWLAVTLTILCRTGEATAWQSWDTPPPATAKRFGKVEVVGAMWQMFGTKTTALLHAGSGVGQQLNSPTRVMLDLLYGANGPLTLVGNAKVATERRDCAKLTIDDGSWLWSTPVTGGPKARLAEYNPSNSRNQQNGVGCALAASDAVAASPTHPAGMYAVERKDCPKWHMAIGGEPTCSINGGVCGGQGDGAARETTKPRLLAPPSPGVAAYLVLPGTVEALVAQATKTGAQLPAANDLSLVVSWCHTNGSGAQDATRLPSLFGANGLHLLTSTT